MSVRYAAAKAAKGPVVGLGQLVSATEPKSPGAAAIAFALTGAGLGVVAFEEGAPQAESIAAARTPSAPGRMTR